MPPLLRTLLIIIESIEAKSRETVTAKMESTAIVDVELLHRIIESDRQNELWHAELPARKADVVACSAKCVPSNVNMDDPVRGTFFGATDIIWNNND